MPLMDKNNSVALQNSKAKVNSQIFTNDQAGFVL